MSCPRCGSWSVRRDRSLAGRMVCGRCGMPLGPGSGSRLATRPRGLAWRWLLPFGLLLLVSAMVAEQSLRKPPGSMPRQGVPVSAVNETPQPPGVDPRALLELGGAEV